MSGEPRAKTALVTGRTSGIGLSVVRSLARAGAQVHFMGTIEERGRRIEHELEGRARCRFVQLDLSHLRGVRDFARQFADEVLKLEVLANIAGAMLPARRVTVLAQVLSGNRTG